MEGNGVEIYTMMLRIKDPEAARLARQLAQETGESVTGAVIESLRQRIARLRDRGQEERVLTATRQAQELLAALPDRDPRPADEILGYDDAGLPN